MFVRVRFCNEFKETKSAIQDWKQFRVISYHLHGSKDLHLLPIKGFDYLLQIQATV